MYETKFKHDLKEWESYAQKVASSKFLMGEKKETFKASFAWLLKDETIDAILNGAYGVGNRTTDTPTDSNAQEMVEIWKSNIGFKNKSFTLTKSRLKKLQAVFKSHFNLNIEDWKSFVSTITESNFLMGKSKSDFKISLDWILNKKETILKIKEGNYHTQAEWDNITANQKANTAILDLQNNTTLDSRWKSTLKKAAKVFGVPTYVSWFSRLKFKSEEEGVLTLQAQSGFTRSYIETHYSRKLLNIASQYFGDLRKISLCVISKGVVL